MKYNIKRIVGYSIQNKIMIINRNSIILKQ